METKLIIPVDDLREALLFDDIDDVNTAIREAIESAQQSILDEIRQVSVERFTVVDEFWLKNSLVFRGSNPQATLSLSRGFVDSGETYNAYAAVNYKDLSVANDRINLKSNNGINHVVLTDEFGRIRIVDLDASNYYIRVSYTCGFATDSGTPPIYEDTPEWLKQAVRLRTQVILNTNPVLPRPSARQLPREDETLDQPLRGALGAILGAHVRYLPMTEHPFHSEYTAI